MRRVGVFGTGLLFVLFLAVAATADIATFTLGDVDGLGFGISSGGAYPTFPFDNRSASDPSFTDFGAFGETDANFTFNYASPGDVLAASLEFGLAGLEDAHNDSAMADFDDRLFLDSVEIPSAFDSDYTGISTYGIVNLDVPTGMLSYLSDGVAAFFFDGWFSGTVVGSTRLGDQVSFDYVTLSIEYTEMDPVPEPATLTLLLVGLASAAALRKRRSR